MDFRSVGVRPAFFVLWILSLGLLISRGVFLEAQGNSKAQKFQARSDKGAFEVVYDPSGIERIRQVHGKRDVGVPKAHQLPVLAEHGCIKPDYPRSAEFICVNEKGQLEGAAKPTGSPFQPFQFWSYNLNMDGTLAKAVVSGGIFGKDDPAVFVRLLDATGREYGRVVLTVWNTYFETLDSF